MVGSSEHTAPRNRFTYMVVWLASLAVIFFGPRQVWPVGLAIGASNATAFILGAYFGREDAFSEIRRSR